MNWKNPLTILLPAALLFTLASGSSAEDQCHKCHQEAGGELAAPVLQMEQNDIHASRGFSCADCHGGDRTSEDAEVAMSPARGFLGVPGPQEIPQMCARCHSNPQIMRQYSVSLPTDQLEKYAFSKHGIALKAGKTDVATCASCHGSHTILPANNPKSSVWPVNVPQTCRHCHGDAELMTRHDLPGNTFDEYKQSVHGKALLEKKDVGAPACNDCHGNHGAAPPGIETVAQVCRLCHINNAEMFLASPHKAAFDERGKPECAVCHNNHLIVHPTDDWLSADNKEGCCNKNKCHAEGDAGFAAAQTMKSWIDSLRMQEQAALDTIQLAEKRGIEVAEAQTALEAAREALLKSHTLVHTVDTTQVKAVVQVGLASADTALQIGRQGLAAFSFRKRGLGLATIFITLLIIAIWLKLRDYEKKKNSMNGAQS